MKHYVSPILAMCVLLFASHFVVAEPLKLPAIQVSPIQDSATGREYELYVKLPEDYDAKSEKTHPVIYIVDALWNMEVISGSIEYFVKDAILVGISWEKGMQPQRSRMRDYMPTKYTGDDYKHPTGQAHEHLAFIRNDVFKRIESQYKADPKRRTYYGFSVGGTFGTYILLTQTDSFKNYIIGSPSTYFGEQFAHEYAPHLEKTPEKISANVFLSVGANESQRYVDHAFGLKRFLMSRKSEEAKFDFDVISDADHGRAFPLSTMQSLIWLSSINPN